MKIAASARSSAEIVAHVDSDNVFIRPLKLEHLAPEGRVRIYRNAEKVELETHRVWHETAGRLLGLPPSRFYGAEYINPFVVWRRSIVRGLIERIESVSGRDWRIVLARTPHFAEYVLYGVYAEQVIGLDEAGLIPQDFTLCHARWGDEFEGEADVKAFLDTLEPWHVTSLIQSTIGTTMAERRAVFDRVEALAEAQDQAPGRLA
jgi:hypothetical protein